MGNLASSLKYLKDNPVKRGDPVESAARSDRMNALTDAILSLSRGEHMRKGPGIRLKTSEGLVTISGTSGGGDGGSSDLPDIAFLLSDATTTEEGETEESNKVEISDGKINGEFPSGMGAGPAYVLDLDDPADAIIYAAVSFNPTTLAITSRSLGTSSTAGFPESRIEDLDNGFLYWQLGFTYMDPDDGFTIVVTRVGDINFALIYGALNGAPAVIPVESGVGFVALPSALL